MVMGGLAKSQGAFMSENFFNVNLNTAIGESVSLSGFTGKESSPIEFGGMLGFNTNKCSISPSPLPIKNPNNLAYPFFASGSFTEYYMAMGIFLDLPLHKVAVIGRALPGINYCTSPVILLANNTDDFILGPQKVSALSIDAGLGLEYALGAHWGVALMTDYYVTTAAFKSDYLNFGPRGLFNFSTGVSYNLGQCKLKGPQGPETSEFLDTFQMEPSVPDSLRDRPKGYYLTINGGIGVPLKDFSAAGGGNALSGPSWNIVFGMPIAHSPIGFACVLGDGWNIYSVSALEASLLKNTGNASTVTIGTPSNYREIEGMIGALAIAREGKLSFDFRLMAGVMNFTTPEIDYTSFYQNPNFPAPPYEMFESIQSSNTNVVVVDGGITLRFTLCKNLCAVTNFDIMSTPKDIVMMVNLTGGLGYQF